MPNTPTGLSKFFHPLLNRESLNGSVMKITTLPVRLNKVADDVACHHSSIREYHALHLVVSTVEGFRQMIPEEKGFMDISPDSKRVMINHNEFVQESSLPAMYL